MGSAILNQFKKRMWWAFSFAVLLLSTFSWWPISNIFKVNPSAPYDLTVAGVFVFFLALFHIALCGCAKVSWPVLKFIDYVYYFVAALGAMIGMVEFQYSKSFVESNRIKSEITNVESRKVKFIDSVRKSAQSQMNGCKGPPPANRPSAIEAATFGVYGIEIGGFRKEYCLWMNDVLQYLSGEVTTQSLRPFLDQTQYRLNASTNLGRFFALSNFLNINWLIRTFPAHGEYPIIILPSLFDVLSEDLAQLDVLRAQQNQPPSIAILKFVTRDTGIFWAPLIFAFALALRITKVSAEVQTAAN